MWRSRQWLRHRTTLQCQSFTSAPPPALQIPFILQRQAAHLAHFACEFGPCNGRLDMVGAGRVDCGDKPIQGSRGLHEAGQGRQRTQGILPESHPRPPFRERPQAGCSACQSARSVARFGVSSDLSGPHVRPAPATPREREKNVPHDRPEDAPARQLVPAVPIAGSSSSFDTASPVGPGSRSMGLRSTPSFPDRLALNWRSCSCDKW